MMLNWPSVEVSNDRVNLHLIFPETFLSALTDQQVEDINEQFRITFTPYNFQRIDLDVRRSDGVYQPLSKFLKPIEQPRKEPPSPPFPRRMQGKGALSPLR